MDATSNRQNGKIIYSPNPRCGPGKSRCSRKLRDAEKTISGAPICDSGSPPKIGHEQFHGTGQLIFNQPAFAGKNVLPTPGPFFQYFKRKNDLGPPRSAVRLSETRPSSRRVAVSVVNRLRPRKVGIQKKVRNTGVSRLGRTQDFPNTLSDRRFLDDEQIDRRLCSPGVGPKQRPAHYLEALGTRAAAKHP